MTFENIQDIIAERINKLKDECAAIDTALGSEDLDLNSPVAQQLYNRQIRFQDNLNLLENIAYFIISQESENEVLRLKAESDSRLISYLRQSYAQERTARNAALAVTNLLLMQKKHWNDELENDLKKEFSLEEYQTLIPQLTKIAA